MWKTLIGLFLLAPGLTILLEFPIVYFSGSCRKPVYILAVNGLTNLTLNLVSLFLAQFAPAGLRTAWVILAEALLIPNGEAQLYRLISGQRLWKIYVFTYVANGVSFGIGLLLQMFL